MHARTPTTAALRTPLHATPPSIAPAPQADQGSGHFAATVALLKARAPGLRVECLTPDFRGDRGCIDAVARSGLDVFAHNVETPERLQGRVRDHRAGWAQSLGVLQRAKVAAPGVLT